MSSVILLLLLPYYVVLWDIIVDSLADGCHLFIVLDGLYFSKGEGEFNCSIDVVCVASYLLK